jgi:hypothetical protein
LLARSILEPQIWRAIRSRSLRFLERPDAVLHPSRRVEPHFSTPGDILPIRLTIAACVRGDLSGISDSEDARLKDGTVRGVCVTL